MASEGTLRAYALSRKVQPDGERDANHDPEASEERVPTAEAQRVEHLLAEQRECETKHGTENLEKMVRVSLPLWASYVKVGSITYGSRGQCTCSILECVYEV